MSISAELHLCTCDFWQVWSLRAYTACLLHPAKETRDWFKFLFHLFILLSRLTDLHGDSLKLAGQLLQSGAGGSFCSRKWVRWLSVIFSWAFNVNSVSCWGGVRLSDSWLVYWVLKSHITEYCPMRVEKQKGVNRLWKDWTADSVDLWFDIWTFSEICA